MAPFCNTPLLATALARQCYHLKDKEAWRFSPCFTANWFYVTEMGMNLFPCLYRLLSSRTRCIFITRDANNSPLIQINKYFSLHVLRNVGFSPLTVISFPTAILAHNSLLKHPLSKINAFGIYPSRPLRS
jgi:hypothetical protein